MEKKKFVVIVDSVNDTSAYFVMADNNDQAENIIINYLWDNSDEDDDDDDEEESQSRQEFVDTNTFTVVELPTKESQFIQ